MGRHHGMSELCLKVFLKVGWFKLLGFVATYTLHSAARYYRFVEYLEALLTKAHSRTLEPSQYRLMQAMQKLCPHGVDEGLVNTSRQMEHRNCSSDRKLASKDILWAAREQTNGYGPVASEDG